MNSAATMEGSVVDVTELADGVIVRLGGRLDTSCVRSLRLALLAVGSSDHRDVLVDAGEVSEVSDTALAILLAAPTWAVQNGRRFAVTRMSPALHAELEATGLTGELPPLPAPGTRTALTAAPTHPLAL